MNCILLLPLIDGYKFLAYISALIENKKYCSRGYMLCHKIMVHAN